MIHDLQQYQAKINETADFLKTHLPGTPKTAIMLGSGLGGLVEHLDIIKSLIIRKYRISPFFGPRPCRQLVHGKAGNNEVLCFRADGIIMKGIP